MKEEFEMTDLGLMKYFLGIQVKQSSGEITLYQERYIDDFLKKFHMENCKPMDTPMAANQKLQLDDGATKVDRCNYSKFSDVASSREPFDLCEQHYGNSFNLPSLFNQQHNSEHKFNNVGGARITIAGVLRMNENKLMISISRGLGNMAPRTHMMNLRGEVPKVHQM
ncbi:hypothetical protein AgCh_013168 [Apium graveolens]